ncbi:uridine-cytidine kinase-like 1 [Sphaeroforma arctica JP610]|uniref:Uridine kinase n=1 Tax=Sphaeroforma arctica JP610 TaxID=667725 RepID=A0A0L0FXH3_9EUKA|nr:uridine-cytidine kinase-like 1 [Sphaeroforma arctica JP610]KNC81344.1 uridine-cytidine kinase-like 1 [Sphaeroforma arctica JP610]|eukprot:XP_014155246.1 uridine-cytidine kinase-like 1 [Sphaeroforma arctica JP610]
MSKPGEEAVFHTSDTTPTRHGSVMLTSTPQAQARRTIFTAGRPPWYDATGETSHPFVIGITGGSASGKTTVAQSIIEELGVRWVVLMSLDSFYKALTEEEKEQAGRNEYNFDHPNAFDYDCAVETLKKLREGKGVELPVYDFSTHSRLKETQKMYGANVILFEGIMAFHNPELRALMDMKIFVDTDSDIRLARRLRRDIAERGRDLVGVLEQYSKFVKPSFDEFIYPTMKYADVVVPRGADNLVALDLIVKHVKRQLTSRGHNFRDQLIGAHAGEKMPDSLHVLPSTRQIKGLHTMIRNRDCPRDELIFYSQRLMRLIMEYSWSFLPFKPKTVTTPRNIEFEGKALDAEVCAVSIVRAGVTMESTLREIAKEIPIGKILIQTDEQSGEPALHYYSLPQHIGKYHVILLDSTIATGAAALMAIRVLLDHDVKEEHIIFLSLIAATPGIHAVAYAFPKVKIITSEVDETVDENFFISPGIGNFGDLYFGTN